MSKAKDYPHLQPFNIGAGHKNRTKKNAWWQRNPPQNNTQRKGNDGEK